MAEAEERAAPGFYEFKGDDGSLIQVQASVDGVTVAQHSQGAFGRGAAVLTADQADELAAAVTAAGKASRDAAAAAKAETPAAEAAEPVDVSAAVNTQVLPEQPATE